MTPTFFMQTILSFRFIRSCVCVREFSQRKKEQSNSLLVKIELPRRSATSMLFASCGGSTSVSHKKFLFCCFIILYPPPFRKQYFAGIPNFPAGPSVHSPVFPPAKKGPAGRGSIPQGQGKRAQSAAFSVFSLAKYSLVALITTPDRAARAMRLGRAMRPLRVSAMSQTRPRSVVAPTTMMST